MTPSSDKSIAPVTYCSDPDVQRFIEYGFVFGHPYGDRAMTADELVEAAHMRFGDMRCFDLCIVMH